jgi:hypothetical protein
VTVPTHFRFTARGVFDDTPEAWSFGFHFERTVVAGGDAGLSDINDGAVTTAFDDLFSNSLAQLPNNATMTDWRAYVIGTNGRMEGNPKVVDVTAENISGTGGMAYPPQIALVVTLVADNRGPARFGRFYLPTRIGIGSDSRASVTDVTNLAGAVTDFLKDISGAIDLPGTTESADGVNVSSSSGGVLQSVDHVEVGRCLDTLRNRRKSMDEDRVIGGQIDW